MKDAIIDYLFNTISNGFEIYLVFLSTCKLLYSLNIVMHWCNQINHYGLIISDELYSLSLPPRHLCFFLVTARSNSIFSSFYTGVLNSPKSKSSWLARSSSMSSRIPLRRHLLHYYSVGEFIDPVRVLPVFLSSLSFSIRIWLGY